MHNIVHPDKAAALRARFIDAFVDTSTDYFHEQVKVKPTDIVYDFYIYMYLWDTLLPNHYTVVPFSRCIETISEKKRVYSLWDIRPKEIVHTESPWLWPNKEHYLELYASDTVIEWDAEELLAVLKKELEDYDAPDYYLHNTLPEDLYIFDDSFSWCVIFTHESTQDLVPGIKGERFCLLCTGKNDMPDSDIAAKNAEH